MLPNTTFNNTETLYSIKSTSRALLSIFFIISSFGGNTLVLFAVYRFRRLRTISNMIIANLSLVDVLFSVFVAPINAFYWSQEGMLPSVVACHVSGVGALLFGLGSIYTLVFVSVERFLATSFPLKHRNSFGVNAVKYGLAVIWIWSGALCAFTFAVSRYTYIGSFFHCIADWKDSLIFTLVILFLGNILPLAILIYCNACVLRIIHKRKRIQAQPQRQVRKTWNSYAQRQKRVSLVVIAVISMFILCWTPYCVSMLCLAVDGRILPEEFMSAAVVLTIANGSLNPLIYGVMNRNFRESFVRILGLTKQTEETGRVREFVADSKDVPIF